jgi:hypothetical protein
MLAMVLIVGSLVKAETVRNVYGFPAGVNCTYSGGGVTWSMSVVGSQAVCPLKAVRG